MSRKLVLCAVTVALLCFSSSTPAAADGAVYFPVESPSGVSETWIYATNDGNQPETVTVRFIPILQDGTKSGAEEKTFEVRARRTGVLKDAVAPGQVGLLEVQAPDHVSVSARLTETGAADDDVPFARVPIISTRTASEGGVPLDLLGFQRLGSGQVVSDVRLVNLSPSPNPCQAEVFRGDGENLWGTILLGELNPLSLVPFDDFLVALGELQSNTMRVRFQCDDTFYAFGAIRESNGTHMSFIQPSAAIGVEGVPVPGEEPPGGGGGGGGGSSACVDADICFERQGLFHHARRGDAHEPLELPIPPGQYRKIHLNVDILNAGPPNLRGSSYVEQLVFWLAVTNHYNLYGFVRLRNAGPGFELSNTHGVGVPFANKVKQTTGLHWPFGQTYNFDYVYDAENRRIALTVKNSSGNVVGSLQGTANVNRITMPSASHEIFHLVFGYNEGRENKNEYISNGWQYRNLSVGIYR